VYCLPQPLLAVVPLLLKWTAMRIPADLCPLATAPAVGRNGLSKRHVKPSRPL
jgi:hypothetical protein